MSEQPNQAAAQPVQAAAQPAQAQQSGSGLPDGYQPISKADYERLTRYEQQVRGFQPLYERLTKSGIKSVDDWSRFEPDVQTLAKRGLKPGSLAAMFSEEADSDLSGGQSQPQQIDLARLREEMRSEILGDVHTLRHEDARKGDSGIIEKAISKVLGEGEHDEFTKELTKRAVKDWLEENRPTYPDGHPLAGKYLAPLTQELADKVAETFSGLRAKQAGAELADKAAQAAAPVKKVGTVGGGGGSTGKPNSQPQSRSERQRASMEAHLAQLRAKRGATG